MGIGGGKDICGLNKAFYQKYNDMTSRHNEFVLENVAHEPESRLISCRGNLLSG